MADAHSIALMAKAQDEFVRNAVDEHGNRLFGFIRNRVNDVSDAEDILQDVWYELTETSRLDVPVEQVAAWLFRVARNKIIDKYRKKSTVLLDDTNDADDEDAPRLLDQLLPASYSDPSRRIEHAQAVNAAARAGKHLVVPEALCHPLPAKKAAGHLFRIIQRLKQIKK